MFDDLTGYFYENVVSAFEDYLTVKRSGKSGCSKDIRAAMNAASALFHLREHLPSDNGLSRKEAERLCMDYAVLGDIVNASKHNSIDCNTPHGVPLVTSAADIYEVIIITQYEDKNGVYRFFEKMVDAKLTDGTIRNVPEVLTNVMNFWQAHLHSLGIIDKPRTYVLESDHQPKSRADCESSRMNLELVKGLRFRQAIRPMRYNYETGVVEPVDMTGCQARMTIRALRYDVDIYITHGESGRERKVSISLTEGESTIFARFKTDAEKLAYVNSLPSAQRALQQLAVEDRQNQENLEDLSYSSSLLQPSFRWF